MKKLLVTALTTVLVASMVACGGKNDVTTETTQTPEVSTETVETPAVSTETETVVTDGGLTVGDTAGQILFASFQEMMAAKPETTAQEAADALITNEIIQFMGGTMPVEPGFLQGFKTEITGFEEAVVFMPMIGGAIPFVGYVFDLAADADVEAFMTTLKENADMRWNICVEAEEMVVEAIGDKVFFLMCKKDLSAQ